MDNFDSIEIVNNAKFADRFSRPLYDSYCFSNIPNTILRFFGDKSATPTLPAPSLSGLKETYDNTVLVLLDSFGWCFLERYCEDITIEPVVALRQAGITSKLTALFPSPTTASVTDILTNLPPGQSQLFEWFQYEPVVGDIIIPLLFTFTSQKERGLLIKAGYSPDQILPEGKLFPQLRSLGVTPYISHPRDYDQSPYNQRVCKEAARIHYDNPAHGLAEIVNIIRSGTGPNYFYYYYPFFDSEMHHHGPNSAQADQVAHIFFNMLERELISKLSGNSGRTLLLLTADHGQVYCSPQSTVFLDRYFPNLTEQLSKTPSDRPIGPCGDYRDLFLHVLPGSLDELAAFLSEKLKDIAAVFPVSQLEHEGLFGPLGLTPATRERMGNLAVLPFDNNSVFLAGEHGEYVKTHVGHHGGLSKHEMEIPFIAVEL